MYGTVGRFSVKAGRRADIDRLLQEWNTKQRPKIDGPVSAYVLNPESDSQEMIIITMFANKEVYQAAANDQEQGAWVQRFMECLDSEPQGHVGEIIEI